MSALEDVYEDLETDVSLDEFREAVEEKVAQMGGLADEETAAMLIAHELTEDEVRTISDISPGMEEVQFVAKVIRVGELRTFERDEEEEGYVVNVEAADESGSTRLAFWDEQAQAIVEEGLEAGTVLRVRGRPKEGYNGLEVSVYQAEEDPDAAVDVQIQDTYRIGDLSFGLSDVTVQGRVLDTDSVRTFDRDDGSQGKVANLVIGDETGRVRVTMWDDRAEQVETIDPDSTVEVVDGYVRERDGTLELHVGDRGAIEEIDEEVRYVPDVTDVAALEIGETVDIAGVIRSADPVRTFDRDDGSEGKVRNVRLQDETGDIRVALWGEKADRELAPGDTVCFADVEIKEGWQEDLEASAGWRSTITTLDGSLTGGGRDHDESTGGSGGEASLASFGGENAGVADTASDTDATAPATDSAADATAADATAADATAATTESEASAASTGGVIEFTGTVVQTGEPLILDNGEETMTVETDETVTLGQQVTVRGVVQDGRIDADEVF